MERRSDTRYLRRLQVQFTEHGNDGKRHMGYTANVSTSGMYIYTGHLAAKGARLRVKLISEDRSANVLLEAEVIRRNRSMHTLKTSGMGVRFLAVDELVSEVLPDLSLDVTAPNGAAPATSAPQVEAPAAAPAPEVIAEPAPGPTSAAAPATPGPRPEPISNALYKLRFANRQQFIEAYKRDLSTGGLFVPTDHPAPLNEMVSVEVSIDEPGSFPVRFEARVVHRIDPDMPAGTGTSNLMAGMGLELQNFNQTLVVLRTLAELP